MRKLLVFSFLGLVACNHNPLNYNIEDISMSPIAELKAGLKFDCAHEFIPAPTDEAELVFKYARWLQKNNELKREPEKNVEVERLYRIAAESGHHRARINLQNGAMRRQFKLKGEEYQRFSQELIDADVATGYYFVARFVKHGAFGLRENPEMALRYYRKAADKGSAQAQQYIADLLAPIDIAPEVARQLRRCAAEQGNRDAAVDLAIDFAIDGHYEKAVEVFQLGVAAGSPIAASFLEEGFKGPPPERKLYYLALEKDLERAKRYEEIGARLSGFSYAHPTVPDVNEIVPLPPAELPEWDGKLRWVKERKANIPPPKPSDELILRLANAKKLDPATGKPLPSSPDFTQANFPQQICYPGEACPQAGHWKVIWPSLRNVRPKEVIRYFDEGDIFPLQTVERYHLRPWPLRDKTTFREEAVEWGLIE